MFAEIWCNGFLLLGFLVRVERAGVFDAKIHADIFLILDKIS